MLLGSNNNQGLKLKLFKGWISQNYDGYNIDNMVIKKFKDSLKNHTINFFLGTWCGDSRKEVPRFYFILDVANFPENQLEVFALSFKKGAYKKGQNSEEKA